LGGTPLATAPPPDAALVPWDLAADERRELPKVPKPGAGMWPPVCAAGGGRALGGNVLVNNA